jgi:hypothetical protein
MAALTTTSERPGERIENRPVSFVPDGCGPRLTVTDD